MPATTQSTLPIDLTADPVLAPTPRIERPMLRDVFPSLPSTESLPQQALLGRYILQLPRVAWMLLDTAIAFCGLLLGHRLFVWWDAHHLGLNEYSLLLAGVALAPSVVLSGNIFGLYDCETLWSRPRIIARGMMTVIAAMAAVWLVMHLFMYSELSRRSVATGVIFYLISASTIRLLAHQLIRNVRRGLLVIGQGPLTGTIVRSVRRGSVPGYRLVGVIKAGMVHDGDIPVIGQVDEIEEICRRHSISEVVVANESTHQREHVRAALACLRLGCRVTDETTFFESTYGEVPVTHIQPTWFLAADLKAQRREHAFAKRIFDTTLAAIGLVLTAPLMLLVAAIIRLREGGPAIYSQTRVGQGGRTFTLYKFRTMIVDAEADGMAWCQANDPRITPFGHFLRRSRIDELPQLWNILRGDMSIVGPRPERPEFTEQLSQVIPFYDERHLIKPGLTGWAQINFSYGASVSDARRKLQLDLFYIKHAAFELDLVILLRTFGTFFLGSR